MKIKLLVNFQPSYNVCTLGLYGRKNYIQEFSKFYIDIVEQKNWKYDIYSVWSNNSVPELQSINFSDDEKRFMGYEISIAADLAYLFFRQEGGLQHWEYSETKDKKEKLYQNQYFVVVYNDNFKKNDYGQIVPQLPASRVVHYYELQTQLANYRRYWGLTFFEDKKFNLKLHNEHAKNAAQTMNTLLENDFNQRIDFEFGIKK